MRAYGCGFSLLMIALVVGSGCFTELRSLSCASDADCFTHERETCVIADGEDRGRCFRVREEENGEQVDNEQEERGEPAFGRVLRAQDDEPLALVRVQEEGGGTICTDTMGEFRLNEVLGEKLTFSQTGFFPAYLNRVEGGWIDGSEQFWPSDRQILVLLWECTPGEEDCPIVDESLVGCVP